MSSRPPGWAAGSGASTATDTPHPVEDLAAADLETGYRTVGYRQVSDFRQEPIGVARFVVGGLPA
jgi:hypothetical protein